MRLIAPLMTLVLVMSGCNSDDACAADGDCFAGEICVDRTCRDGKRGTSNAATNSDTSSNNLSANNAVTNNQVVNSATNNGTTPNNVTPNNVATNNASPNNSGSGYRFVALAAGEDQTCALDSEDGLWCWGQNGNGRLSVVLDDDIVDQPQRVEGIDQVTDVVAGRNFQCALRADQTVWCWGRNQGIDQGSSSTTIIAEPTQMPIADIVQLEAGGTSACALESDRRTLWCWGYSEALMVPTFDQDIVDFAVGDAHVCAVTNTGDIRCWGSNYYEALATGDPVQGISGATAIAAGERHSCAVASGEVWCWGWNEEGQGGRPPVDFQEKFDFPQKVDGISNATNVFAGSSYSCALHDGDEFTCWGGILGYESTVYTDNLITGPTQLFGIGSGVTEVGAGWIHTCVAKTDQIWCWGDNSTRQLGGGDNFRYEQPLQVMFPPE